MRRKDVARDVLRELTTADLESIKKEEESWKEEEVGRKCVLCVAS